jgi:hypothetical protein
MTEPVGETGPTPFVDSLGDRGVRRAEPRTSVAVAGAGCALAVLGVLVVAGDTGIDDATGDFNKVPGILLAALVVTAGYAVLANVSRGALATAGTVAASLGVPPLLFFLTFDDSSSPPYSTEGILIVSTVAWLGSYALGPARGRPFFLGAGLIGVWLTLLQLTEDVLSSPFDLLGSYVVIDDGSSGSFDPETGEIIPIDRLEGPSAPDPTTIGLLSMGLGVAFVLASRRLDRQGRHGAATPFAVAALPCLFVGVIALADDLEAAGTGLLMVALGLGLACHGASVWRRATTWIGAGVMASGAAVFLTDMTPDDNVTIGGLLLVAGGIGMVFAGHALSTAMQEPDEMTVSLGLPPVSRPPAVQRRQITTAPNEPAAGPWAPPAAPPPTPIPPPPGAPPAPIPPPPPADPPIPPPPPPA